MAVNLSAGSVHMICNSHSKHVDINPILQVHDVRTVQTTNSAAEYRLFLSDGLFIVQAMLASQNNDLVNTNRIVKGSVVKLNEFVYNRNQTRVKIIIVKLDIVLEQCETIGDPKPFPPIADGATLPTSKPSPASTISHTTSSNPQYQSENSFSDGLMQQNVGMGSYMQAPGQGRSAGPPLYSSSASKGESGKYYQTSAFGYSNTESATGLSRSPSNSHVRPIQPYMQTLGQGRSAGPPLYSSSASQGESGKYNQTSASGYSNTESATGLSRSPSNSHVRPIQPAFAQLPPMYGNRGPIAKNGAPPWIVPIAALSPYQGRWTIKARVTAKGDLRQYSNQRGEGKVFSFDLLDSEGGEIRATCFNAAADQFYHQIEEGKVYLISKGTLKPAQRNFNHLPNDHEIMLDSSSTVQPCFEGEHSIPQQRFQFRLINEIEGIESNTIIDVIGVLCSISPSTPIMRKNGTETLKRSLQIKDMSGRSVEVTLWGKFCNAEGQTLQTICDSGVFPVLAVKSAKVNDFSGKTVGTIPTSKVIIEPDIPEAHKIKAWMENDGKNASVSSISRETAIGRQDVRKTISQIKDENLGTSEKPDWITVTATPSYLKTDNFCYTACPLKIGERQCNKKVINNGDGTWRCERCDQSVEECDYRYILQFLIQDHTGLTWVTGFQEIGEEIFGTSAKELFTMKFEDQDDEKFSEFVYKVLFNKYLFKLKVKEETFGDQQLVKSTVVKVDKLDFVSETRSLLDSLNKCQGDDSVSVALKSENSILNTAKNNAAYSSVGIKESVQQNVNYMGNICTAGQGIGLLASQVGQFGNQNVGSGLASTGPTTVYMRCSTCGQMGHSSIKCPAAMDGQEHSFGGGYSRTISAGSGSAGDGGECFKCHQPGHWASNSPNAGSAHPSYGSGNISTSAGDGGSGSGECFKCHQPGHWSSNCPNAGSALPGQGSGNISTSVGGGGECFKCHQNGHWAKDCPSAGERCWLWKWQCFSWKIWKCFSKRLSQ